MKTWNMLLGFLWGILYVSLSVAGSSPEGTWVTIDDKTGEKGAVIQVVLKDGVLNGTIVDVYAHPEDTGVW